MSSSLADLKAGYLFRSLYVWEQPETQKRTWHCYSLNENVKNLNVLVFLTRISIMTKIIVGWLFTNEYTKNQSSFNTLYYHWYMLTVEIHFLLLLLVLVYCGSRPTKPVILGLGVSMDPTQEVTGLITRVTRWQDRIWHRK